MDVSKARGSSSGDFRILSALSNENFCSSHLVRRRLSLSFSLRLSIFENAAYRPKASE